MGPFQLSENSSTMLCNFMYCNTYCILKFATDFEESVSWEIRVAVTVNQFDDLKLERSDEMRRCDGREIFYRPTKSTAPWITTFALRQSINIYMPSSSILMLIQQGVQVLSLVSNISWLQPTFTILHFREKKEPKSEKRVQLWVLCHIDVLPEWAYL